MRSDQVLPAGELCGYGRLTLADHDASSFFCRTLQLIFSAFKTLTGQQVTIELKNDLAIQGTLKSVDQYVPFTIQHAASILKTSY